LSQVRNSWNTDWGIKGYIHVELGTNACGIANEATFPTIAK
jgi:C1A family cysteine protease